MSPVSTPPAQPSLPGWQAPFSAYATRLRDAKATLTRLDLTGARIANLRFVSFLAGLGLAIARLFQKLPPWGTWASLACFVGFAALVVWHARVTREELRAGERVRLNERGLARVSGGWHEFTQNGEAYGALRHPYAADLDVVGPGSLFQLIDETATRAGEERLVEALLHPPPLPVARRRQGAVRELAGLLDFRQRLVVEARTSAVAKTNTQGLIAWAEAPPLLDSVRWARPLPFLLPPATLVLYLLWDAGKLPAIPFVALLVLQFLTVALTRGRFGELFNGLTVGEGGLARLTEAFALVESQRFEDTLLRELAGNLGQGQGPGAAPVVSRTLARLARVYGFAELRRNQLHPAFNLFLLFDCLTMFRLEGWRREHGKKVRGWFDALGELEALTALAGFAHDRPEAKYPELTDGPACLVARGLGHPLLDGPVLNDVSLATPGEALLITGSNMAGKTTLLRALGANVVLARAGAPVLAESLRISALFPLTSMRVKDSLERGVSYFYAEVERLKLILDLAAEHPEQGLFLLDEVLLGTNARERQIASREVIRLFLQRGAIGGVSTHDLSLATLEKETQGRVRNIHLRDTLEGGTMHFDYRVREGVVDTTNALRVLAQAGIPISAEE